MTGYIWSTTDALTRPDEEGATTYAVFACTVSDKQARDLFRQSFGVEPARLVRDHNFLWAGPVPLPAGGR